MSKHFLEHLYGMPIDGPGMENPLESAFSHIFEEAAKEEEFQMKTSKAPLMKVLGSLGISGDVEEHPGWCDLTLEDGDAFRAATNKLADAENVYKLAEAGWVPVKSGDAAMSNEPAEFHIHFLDIAEIEGGDSEKGEDLEKVIKKAREFATTEPDRDDDMNPVDSEDGDMGENREGIGDAKDGAKPEGKVKDSAATTVSNLLEDEVSECGLEQYKKGDGLETKGRGGKKLGRKFKMPGQWKQNPAMATKKGPKI